MIHPNIVKRMADEDGLSASVVERDYVLAHVLAAVSRGNSGASFVFKGGTALRLCHFEDYRYSAAPPHFDGALRAVRRELRFALR